MVVQTGYDPSWPGLLGSGGFVVVLLLFQLSLLESARPKVHQLIVSKQGPSEEVSAE